MSKEFRYHPVVEGLRVNEDGTEIWLGNRELSIKESYIEVNKRVRRAVNFGSKHVTVSRLVCECWHGMAENGDFSATMIDETKGQHYTNLYWAKRGMLINPIRRRKVSEVDYLEIQDRLKTEKLIDIIKDYPFTKATYCNFKRNYGKKED